MNIQHVIMTGQVLAILIACCVLVSLPVILKSVRRIFQGEVSRLNKLSTLPRFDAEGTMLRVLDSPVYYIKTVLMLAPVLLSAFLVYLILIQHPTNVVLICEVVIFILLFLVSVVYWISYIRRSKCYLSIDEQGIKGVFCDVTRTLIPRFEEIDITWDRVSKMNLVEVDWGKLTIDGLELYSGRNLVTIINLELFPSKKVIDCINFYYAQYIGKNELESPLVRYHLENNRVIIFLLRLIVFVSIIFMVKAF